MSSLELRRPAIERGCTDVSTAQWRYRRLHGRQVSVISDCRGSILVLHLHFYLSPLIPVTPLSCEPYSVRMVGHSALERVVVEYGKMGHPLIGC